MALTTDEIYRIRAELGYNVLQAGAAPYIGVVEVFNQVIAAYMTAGAATTSSTVVAAVTAPTPIALTLASAVGFSAGNRVVVDVDDRQEMATVQSVAAPAITVLLSKAHTGTYPVQIDGGETIVRECLSRIRSVTDALGDTAITAAGIKRADEIEFFGSRGESSVFASLTAEREHWRQELADVLGVVYLRKLRRGSAGCYEVY